MFPFCWYLIADFYNAFTCWMISVIHSMSIIPLYRNLSIYLQYKSTEWFLCTRKIVLELLKEELLKHGYTHPYSWLSKVTHWKILKTVKIGKFNPCFPLKIKTWFFDQVLSYHEANKSLNEMSLNEWEVWKVKMEKWVRSEWKVSEKFVTLRFYHCL